MRDGSRRAVGVKPRVKRVAAAFGIVVALLWPSSWLFAGTDIRVEDDSGRIVTLAQPARRIISLAPHVTEILFAIGAGDRVIGRLGGSDFPPQARAIPQVGRYNSLDLEAIVALKPDLVVAWASGTPPQQVRRIEALGIPVFRSEPRRILDVARDMERLGRLAGTAVTAHQAADGFRQRYRSLRRAYAGRAPVRVFYEIWNRPLMTVNGSHLISDVLRLCGGSNVFADMSMLTPRVSTEAVLARNPQVIIASGVGDKRPVWLDAWRRWPLLAAVRDDALYFVSADLINRPGPRILAAATQVCADLENARRRR